MPGYEYRFCVLAYHKAENAQDAAFGSPISRSAIGYEGFERLTKEGWRLRSAAEIRRDPTPELLVILEREVEVGRG